MSIKTRRRNEINLIFFKNHHRMDMANISTNDNKTSSIVDDLVKNEEPPNYTVVNPLFNNRDNTTSNTTQPQSQLRINDNTNITPGTYGVLKVINPELNNINNYTGWSVFNILCCSCILGCVACYFSSETDSLILKGDIQGALNASRTARIINRIATILGTIAFFIYSIIFLLSFIHLL
jgi:hypothetical protein